MTHGQKSAHGARGTAHGPVQCGGVPIEGVAVVKARSGLPLQYISGEGEVLGNKGGGGTHHGAPASMRRRRGFGAAAFSCKVVRTVASGVLEGAL
jgi:hypothetical protein